MVSLYQNRVNGILADDMGMGKTVQSIAILAYLHENYNPQEPFLIVAPKSTIPNWLREIEKWASFLRTVFLNPQKEYRDDTLQNKM